MSDPRKVRIWDLPTRVFHWLLAACVIGAFVTIKAGGLWTEYHMLFGYAVLGLILFRIVWGFVGSSHARFARFVRGPRTIAAYLRGTMPRTPGHNPLGALSVIAMILLLGYQAVTGLFANDDIFTEGPLAGLVGKDLSDRLTGLHKLDELPILILVGLHVSGGEKAEADPRHGNGRRPGRGVRRRRRIGARHGRDPAAGAGHRGHRRRRGLRHRVAAAGGGVLSRSAAAPRGAALS